MAAINPDHFERELQRQPWRRIPGEWREEILGAARAASDAESSGLRNSGLQDQTPDLERRWFTIRNPQSSTFLWPSPRAWAGLAAAWVAIFAMHLSASDGTETIAQEAQAPSTGFIWALQQRQHLMAELIGQSPAPQADPPNPVPAQPRSERSREMRMA